MKTSTDRLSADVHRRWILLCASVPSVMNPAVLPRYHSEPLCPTEMSSYVVKEDCKGCDSVFAFFLAIRGSALQQSLQDPPFDRGGFAIAAAPRTWQVDGNIQHDGSVIE